MINRKNKGNNFEQEMALKLRAIFPYCVTARMQGNLFIDSCGVDLVNTDPFYFQCKHQEKLCTGLHDVLKDMPATDNINIVLWKRNNKGTLAVMDLQDFFLLASKMYNNHKKDTILNNKTGANNVKH